MVWGGGRLANSLGVSYETVFEKFQLYRLLTYGYVQTAVWHLLANGFAFWSVGRYLEKRICTGLLLLVYHTSLAAAGAFIFLFYPNSFNYGASPAIFSCFGLLTHWLVRDKALWRAYRTQKGFVYCVLFFVFSNFLGLASLVIHFLGFATGFLFGFLFGKTENRQNNWRRLWIHKRESKDDVLAHLRNKIAPLGRGSGILPVKRGGFSCQASASLA